MPTRLACRFFAATLVFAVAMLTTTESPAWQVPEGVTSTQNPQDKPLSPREALQRIKMPEGFKVTLFAGEPDVHQPIAMTFDDRGRLWVAECYSYKRWDPKGEQGHDRIIILEDVDRDGKFDKRTIFAENLSNLSGIEIGFDGVWICSSPNLKFIPDANGDDKPDGPAKVMLDGWVVGKVGHNIFNGLTWGPDGWLYGCHGIQDESNVGKPGAPANERTKMRCGIWRFHPQRHTFEVVCHGTTNPWGLDFNEVGEAFFTNCVIGHLWHMIPGAHYKRMYGEDYNQHAYELIDQHADHLHWGGGKWTDSRKTTDAHDKAGGGHAHVGAMIYQGNNWPEEYRNTIGMCNVHGRRLNFDKLERKGSGYIGRRGHDTFHVDDPWFRGVSVKQGPDGAVYISDWCDLGECHDNDGVHTHSGRIYRVSWEGQRGKTAEGEGKIDPMHSRERWHEPYDIRKFDSESLLDLIGESNVWWRRRARIEFQRRAAAGEDFTDFFESVESAIALNSVVTKTFISDDASLQLLLAKRACGTISEDKLMQYLGTDDVRSGWAITFLCEDRDPPAEALEKIAAMAKEDTPFVRLKIASALQRIPIEKRWPIAAALCSHEEDNTDHNLPLMIWYGIEPAVAQDKAQALKLAANCKLKKVRQFIAKRVAAGE